MLAVAKALDMSLNQTSPAQQNARPMRVRSGHSVVERRGFNPSWKHSVAPPPRVQPVRVPASSFTSWR